MGTWCHRDKLTQRHGDGAHQPPWAPPLIPSAPSPMAPMGGSATASPTPSIPPKRGLQGVGHVLVPLPQRLGSQRHTDIGVTLQQEGMLRVTGGEPGGPSQRPGVPVPARSCRGGGGRRPAPRRPSRGSAGAGWGAGPGSGAAAAAPRGPRAGGTCGRAPGSQRP